MGTSVPQQPKCCPGAAPWRGTQMGIRRSQVRHCQLMQGGTWWLTVPSITAPLGWGRSLEPCGGSQCRLTSAQPGRGRNLEPRSEHPQQTGMLKAVVG